MAFDPVQSLLAVSTESGHIHVFGQNNVEVVFALRKRISIAYLRIVKSVYLVAVDTDNFITVFNMESREEASSHQLYGKCCTVTSDPAMDWLFIGLDNGQVLVYDIDRGSMANFRIDNLQKSLLPRLRMSPVIDIAIHPRDPSLLLVCYIEAAIVFNIIKQEIAFGLRYEIPPGAPGGDTDPRVFNTLRYPPLMRALWHPNGHHILTVHFDGSLVFWDATEGVLIHARTLDATDVNVPLSGPPDPNKYTGVPLKPIVDVAWNCTQNPEETSLLITGGRALDHEMQGLTMIDFGVTPTIAITTYQAMGNYYRRPRGERWFPMNSDILGFIMLPRVSPYYAGCANPFAFIALLGTSELLSVTYPEGLPMQSVGALPSAFDWVQPYVTTLAMDSVPRNQWLGMLASVPACESFFVGGAPARRHLRKFDTRNALCTGHADGMVRLWDASHGEIETSRVIELNIGEALKRDTDVSVKFISFSGAAAELAVAIETGEVVLYKYGSGKRLDLSDYMETLTVTDQQLQDIRGRTTLKRDGFLPTSLIHSVGSGAVTALSNSNIGFVAIGYENGTLTVLDRRGPAVIFNSKLSELSVKKSGFRRKAQAELTSEYPTALEFGIYALGDDKYSSIVLSVGTTSGNVLTFRIIPNPNGTFSLQFEGSIAATEGPIMSLLPINMAAGISAVARTQEMSQLAQGILIPGGVIAVSKTEIRLLRQPKNKTAHRSDVTPIQAAGISSMRERDSLVLTCVTSKCETVYYSLPSLREIAKVKLPCEIDEPEYLSSSVIMTNGDALIRQNKTSGALINIWGRGIKFENISSDLLYDALKPIPPRPTISTLQWIKGTPVAKIEDIDEVVGGPRRPKSKFMVEQEQAAYEQKKLLEQQSRKEARLARERDTTGYNESGGGAFQSIGRTFESLEEGTNEYLKSLTSVVEDTKSSAFKSAFKAKFF